VKIYDCCTKSTAKKFFLGIRERLLSCNRENDIIEPVSGALDLFRHSLKRNLELSLPQGLAVNKPGDNVKMRAGKPGYLTTEYTEHTEKRNSWSFPFRVFRVFRG
jgi:hypothetical protein